MVTRSMLGYHSPLLFVPVEVRVGQQDLPRGIESPCEDVPEAFNSRILTFGLAAFEDSAAEVGNLEFC